MKKTILTIDGMMCGMCESHVNDAIRANFNVKKVRSSHAKNRCEILSELVRLNFYVFYAKIESETT